MLNDEKLQSLFVGKKASFDAEITKKMIIDFAKLSKDKNRLHTSKLFAKSHGFCDVVTHGMLYASFYSALVGMHLPGEGYILQEVSTRFRHPVFPGERLHIEGEIMELHKVLLRIYVKGVIKNERGIIVSDAKLVLGGLPKNEGF